MKKILILFMTMIVLSACSNDEVNKEISDPNENVE